MTRKHRFAALAALFLAAGFMGCAHCDTCDDMPRPCVDGQCAVGSDCDNYGATGHEECCLVRLKRKIKTKWQNKHGHAYGTEYMAAANVVAPSGQVMEPLVMPNSQIPFTDYAVSQFPASQFPVSQIPASQYAPSAPLSIGQSTPTPPPVPASTSGGNTQRPVSNNIEPPPAPRVEELPTPSAANTPSAPLSELPTTPAPSAPLSELPPN